MQSLLQRLLLGNAGGGGGGNPTLNYNFVDGSAFPSAITFTRASTATFFNSSGVLTSAGNDVPRLDYDPATLAAQGLLIEEQRTNSIRNNTMQGAVAGTPGTLPTNWSLASLGTLTQTVVGTGTENGVTYIDVRFNGTTSTTQLSIRFEPNTQIAAANGQSWSISQFVRTAGGSLSNITGVGLTMSIFDSGGSYLADIGGGDITITSTLTRQSRSGTIVSASAAFIRPIFYVNFASGVAIDITLRIGLPQLEQGAFATSVIPTTTTALTRSADVASVNTLSPWYNATEGTLFVEAQVDTNRSYAGTFRHIVQISPTVNSDSGLAVLINTTNTFENSVRDNAVTVAQLTTGTNTGVVFKSAGAYKVNDFAFSANGGAPATDTSGAVPTTPAVTQMKIGGVRDGNALGQLNGYLRRITYYPVRLTNAALQQITT